MISSVYNKGKIKFANILEKTVDLQPSVAEFLKENETEVQIFEAGIMSTNSTL